MVKEQYYIRSVWHVSLTFTVRHTQIRCTPLVEASGGQEQYYIRSTWHSEECNWEGIAQSDVPPSRSILVVKSTTTSGQIYISLLISCSALVEVCHTLEYSYEKWALQHSGIYVNWSVVVVVVIFVVVTVECCCFVHLLLWISNYSWTRTTKLHSNNNTNLNKKIEQFKYIHLFVVVLVFLLIVTRKFCSCSSVIMGAQWQMNNNKNNNIITQ